MSNETAKCIDQPASERSCPDPAGSVAVWKVEPSYDSAYDYEVSRVSSDPDGRKALERAKEILESKWDSYEPLKELSIAVSIRRGVMHESDLPDGV